MRAAIDRGAWSARGHFAASFGGDELDASLLQLLDLGFMTPEDSSFLATLAAVEGALRRGPHMLRYDEADDFGAPETVFLHTPWPPERLLTTLPQHEELVRCLMTYDLFGSRRRTGWTVSAATSWGTPAVPRSATCSMPMAKAFAPVCFRSASTHHSPSVRPPTAARCG